MISEVCLNIIRNYKAKLLDFPPEITVIVGPNASGKTNILESIFLLSTGKSYSAHLEEEMVNYDTDISRAKGRTKSDGELTDLEAILTRGLIDIGKSAPEKIARKKLLVNGVAKRLLDF